MKLLALFPFCATSENVAVTCTSRPGVLGVSQIKAVSASGFDDCCSQCYDLPGCVAFTFRTYPATGANCYFKDNLYTNATMVGTANHTSGTYPSKTVATRACHLPGHTDYPFCNTSLSIEERVADLVGKLELPEKAPLLTARESPLGAVPRLGLPEYDWGTNCIHGVQSRCGSKCPTSFPNPNAQGAAWNRSLWKEMALVTGVELRALWLEVVGNLELHISHAN